MKIFKNNAGLHQSRRYFLPKNSLTVMGLDDIIKKIDVGTGI
ncbi:MAG: hypothetical protein PUF72_10765 [Clostridiales bacterium]|nr:hypothetical protein [Clostridiales bacterium]